jgi:2-polyprenyl-3-methyl-5-hydroxy-6-metoxy-1,4-benzoquinol methylase
MILEAKPDGYFEHQRHEMLNFIDFPIKKSLDIGCGRGSYLDLLKSVHPNLETCGLELDAESGEIAKLKGHKVLIGNAEEMIDSLPDDYFDLISCNDVLEHFLNPYDILKRLKSKLKDNGKLISSMPNIRYYKPMFEYIFKGDWRYREAGVMDKTHYRFFTQKSIERMFDEAGYKVVRNIGINKGKSLKPFIINAMLIFRMDDIKYPQFATVSTKK